MAWQEKSVLAFTFLGGVGAALTAYATLRILGITKRASAIAGPAIGDPSYVRNTADDKPTRVSIAVMPQDKDHWRIKRIRVWPPWRSLISDIIANEQQDKFGQPITKTRPKKWMRTLSYEPPKSAIGFFVPSDAPRRFRLFVTLSSRADETITSRRATTIRISD